MGDRAILPVSVGLHKAEDEEEAQVKSGTVLQEAKQVPTWLDVDLEVPVDVFLLGAVVAVGAVHPATTMLELVGASLAELLWP